MTYEGWSNYDTWNIWLWLTNEYEYYQAAYEFIKSHPDSKDLYREFVVDCGLSEQRTPDRIPFISDKVNYAELNEAMKELV